MKAQTKSGLLKKIEGQKRILIKAVSDVEYVEQMLKDVQRSEVIIRSSYHDVLREYDSLTRPGRRFR